MNGTGNNDKALKPAAKNEARSTVEKGREYESIVVNYLLQKGYQIRERNFRCRFGEIDLIAEKEAALYFVEVKGQKRDWQSEKKINDSKQKRIIKASVEYVRRFQLWERPVHYDAAIVTGDTLKYYSDAFEGTGDYL